MRTYKTISVKKQEIEEIYCNVCGKPIQKNNHGYFEDHLHIEKTWGYNSKYDGETHHIDVCQSCYEKWVKQFMLSVKETDSKKNIS